MTDTTDIKALRESAESIMNLLENLAGFEPQDIDMDAVELRFEDENGFDTGCDISIVDTAQQSADIIRALLAQLEAERQRADRYHFVAMSALEAQAEISEQLGISEDECDGSPEQIHEKIEMLQTELAALKGEQVPVGIVRKVQQGLHVTLYQSIPEGTELFTAPQKPVVLPKEIEPYEVKTILDPTANIDEYSECVGADMWNAAIRASIKAIKAAGGIVKEAE